MLMSRPKASGAIISQPIDFLLIGGISIIHFLIYWLFDLGTETMTLAVFTLAMTISAFVNYPHFAATNHRFYGRMDYAQQFPVTAIFVPLAMIVLGAIVLIYPDQLLPWFVKLFMIWSPYHFSAQTFGLVVLYAMRSGFELSARARQALYFLVLSTFLAPALRAEAGGEAWLDRQRYFGVLVPVFGLPSWVWPVALTLLCLLFLVALWFLFLDMRRQQRLVPLLVVTPALAQFFWFVPGGNINGYLEFVPAYHSLQYLLIVWLVHLQDRAETSTAKVAPRFLTMQTLRWFAIIFALGGFMFYLLPRVISHLTDIRLMTVAVTVAITFQLHHFFLDGVIWKLRDQKVGSRLRGNLDDLIKPKVIE